MFNFPTKSFITFRGAIGAVIQSVCWKVQMASRIWQKIQLRQRTVLWPEFHAFGLQTWASFRPRDESPTCCRVSLTGQKHSFSSWASICSKFFVVKCPVCDHIKHSMSKCSFQRISWTQRLVELNVQYSYSRSPTIRLAWLSWFNLNYLVGQHFPVPFSICVARNLHL